MSGISKKEYTADERGTSTPAMQAWRLTRRDLRLGSGLVLFTYVALHLLNHALGLASARTAEAGLRAALVLWHSLPGTALLYGAAAIHLALALLAIYERRTLRMSATQALRIWVGLCIPLLLIGHITATRLAFELHGLRPEYARVVWNLWASDNEGRQLALLVPGWLHGCLGLHFAFSTRAWYQRARLPLFGAALLLPVLAALGFVAMGRELAMLGADHAWLQEHAPQADQSQRIALGRLRDGLLVVYFAAIGLVIAGRQLRAFGERRRKALFTLSYPHRRVQVPRGWSVLEASSSFGIPHVSVCGGRARCSTCRVRIVAGTEACPPPQADEQRTLARIGAGADVRLACQLRPDADISVVPLVDAQGGDARTAGAARPATERDVALLFVDLHGWTGSAAHSAHDSIYAINLYLEAVRAAVDGAGGVQGHFAGHYVLAIFGLDTDFRQACTQALGAARELHRRMRELETRLLRDLGFAADAGLRLHAGPAVVGEIGAGATRTLSAMGEAVREAHRIFDLARAEGARFIVSEALLRGAGLSDVDTVNFAWRTLSVDASGASMRVMASDSPDAALSARDR